MPTDPAHCYITPDCGYAPHTPDAHPCGTPIHVGDPCAYCGDPLQADKDGHPVACPKCWRPGTIADLKAIAAEAGLWTSVIVRETPGV